MLYYFPDSRDNKMADRFILPEVQTGSSMKIEPLDVSEEEDGQAEIEFEPLCSHLEPNVLLSLNGTGHNSLVEAIESPSGHVPNRHGSKARKDPIWKYFVTGFDLLGRATCKLCGCDVSRGGIGKRSTNASMKSHLMRKHNSEYEEYIKKKFPDPSKANLDGMPRPPAKESCPRNSEWEVHDPRAVTYHYLIGEMIALDNQPTDFPENIGFKRLMNHIVKPYKVPDGEFFSHHVVPDIYAKCVSIVRMLLFSAKYVSFTFEIWRDAHHINSYINLTAHFVSGDYTFKHTVLDASPLQDDFLSGDSLSSKLNSLFSEWDLPPKKRHLIIHNGSTDLEAYLNLWSFPSGICVIRSLFSIVEEATNSQSAFKDTLTVCRNIVHRLKISTDSSKQTDMQKQPNENNLVEDVASRWNSTYYMLQHILEQRSAISNLKSDFNILLPNDDQWELVRGAVLLLQPFEEITKAVTTSKLVISEVIPLMGTLVRCLNRNNVQCTVVADMANALKNLTEERFSKLCTDNNYTIATFLDPRFKMRFFPEKMQEIVRRCIIEEVCNSSRQEAICANPETSAQKDETPAENCQMSFWECFSEMKGEGQPNSQLLESSRAQMQMIVSNEFAMYLSSPPIAHKENPFVWWKLNFCSFPNLFQLVPKYLSAPATTLFNETLYSTEGDLFEKLRTKHCPRHGKMVTFLNRNLSLLNFDYPKK